MAGHGDTIKEKIGDEFVILKPRNENEFNFYKMLSDAPDNMETYVKDIRCAFRQKWGKLIKKASITKHFETFREHTPYHKNYDKKDGYLLLEDLTGNPTYDYDVYDLKLGRRNFDSQVALRHFYKIGGVLPDNYCPNVKWKNPDKDPPPYECKEQINKVEKQMTKIKGDMVEYGLKVAGKVSIRNGTASEQQKLSIEDIQKEKLHNVKNRNGKYKTLSQNMRAMEKAWYDIMQYGFHAVGMSVLIIVRKDKKGNSVGFQCKFIDFAHVEVCTLIPSVDKLYQSEIYKELLPDRGYRKTKDLYEISYKSLEMMQHLEIGYLLHKQYKINSWYPIVDHLCTVLKNDKLEPCPYGNLDKLDQILLNFFMIEGILGHPLKNSYREPNKEMSSDWKVYWNAKMRRPKDERRDDFGDGWVFDEGVSNGLLNLVRLSENQRFYKFGSRRDMEYNEGPARQFLRNIIRDKKEKEKAARKAAKAAKMPMEGFQLQLQFSAVNLNMVKIKF